jgi:hypothetical protein
LQQLLDVGDAAAEIAILEARVINAIGRRFSRSSSSWPLAREIVASDEAGTSVPAAPFTGVAARCSALKR